MKKNILDNSVNLSVQKSPSLVPENYWSLHLFKQHLKFSSAHFLILNDQEAEKLHGHNYQVQLDLYSSESPEKGYLIDFSLLKKQLKTLVDQWDEQVLLPEKNPEMIFSRTHKNRTDRILEVFFRDRYYAFPEKEVVLLPVINTSVELLSYHLSELFYEFIRHHPVSSYHLRVEETPGQGATYIRYLSK
jgi:6-pyruvoyltetrahydropterin/6-carboxytetrahydropterin synthase